MKGWDELSAHPHATIPAMPPRLYAATVRYDAHRHLARNGRTLCGQIVDDHYFGPDDARRACPSCVMAESMSHFGRA